MSAEEGAWSRFVADVQRLRNDGRPGLTVDEAIVEALLGWMDEQAAQFHRQGGSAGPGLPL